MGTFPCPPHKGTAPLASLQAHGAGTRFLSNPPEKPFCPPGVPRSPALQPLTAEAAAGRGDTAPPPGAARRRARLRELPGVPGHLPAEAQGVEAGPGTAGPAAGGRGEAAPGAASSPLPAAAERGLTRSPRAPAQAPSGAGGSAGAGPQGSPRLPPPHTFIPPRSNRRCPFEPAGWVPLPLPLSGKLQKVGLWFGGFFPLFFLPPRPARPPSHGWVPRALAGRARGAVGVARRCGGCRETPRFPGPAPALTLRAAPGRACSRLDSS